MSAPVRPGDVVADKYQVKHVIGWGGMGVVVAARHLQLGQIVALKFLLPEAVARPEAFDRFQREARNAARLKSEHVARIMDVGTLDSGAPYIVMEYLEGSDLAGLLSQQRTLPVPVAVDFVLQACDAIAEAHALGIIHRDLKPQNLFVTKRHDNTPLVKVLDFGISKSTTGQDFSATSSQAMMGSPAYMSPEQMRSAKLVDVRTDVWALGVILYQLVVGRVPWEGMSLPELCFHITTDPPPPFPDRQQADFEAAVQRCLEKEPDRRFSSVHELAVALLPFAPAHAAPLVERIGRVLQGVAMTGDGPRSSQDAPVSVAARAPGESLSGTTEAPVRAPLPSGTVTLLLTRVAETARLLEDLGDRYAGVVARRDERLRHEVEHHGGSVGEATGDGFLFVFVDARAALQAAVGAQRALAAEIWPHEAAGRVRMGLHTGEPRRAGGRYLGLDVHRATRITAAARGGQILLSAATRAALDDADLTGLEVRDLGPRRLADLRYPEHLFAVGLPGASIHSIAALRHNLPPQPTTFVGREPQIDEARRLLLHPGTRMVTLTGPGGTGKTRLSLEVARAVLAEFPDGVLQVPLAPVSDPSLVMATIAQVLDAPLIAGRPVLDTVKARIGGERMLLVLDNFEQVIDAAPTLAELSAGCPELRLLVTSRQPLKLSAEREYAVPPMQVPTGDGRGGALAECESVRLFVDRVRNTRTDFALTADNAPIVAAICARLEGLPLAIELAASRMKMLTLSALHNRLGDRLGLLKDGPRDAPARHQTLRAAIDWSHNLLDEPDKVLFRRAAVFVGGFAIESAEEVCDFPAGAVLDVFDRLASLADKSLLTRGEVDGEPRLGMLETIREYALDQLGRTGDLAEARARHAAHFVALAEAMAPGLMGRDQRRLVGRMLTEADNLRAALGWALEQPAADTTARLLRALLWLWISQGQFNEAREWARRAVLQARRLGDPRALADVLDVAGWLGFLSGDLADAAPLCAEAVALFAARGDEAAAARVKIALGASSMVTAPIPECERLIDEALAVCRRHGDRFSAAIALNVLGELARASDDDGQRARACYAESIALLQQCDNLFTSTLISSNLVAYHLRDGDWRAAAGLLGKMLEFGQEFNYPMLVYMALAMMGGVAVVRGRAIDGVRLIAAGERMLTSIGLAPEPQDRAERDRHLAAARAAVGEAAVAAAMAEGVGWTLPQAIAATLPLRS
jgi:predicted ATPase/class 3 adenylate cyclase